eukprot:TRINITY_DN4170_c0_g1_i1.p1 TRINITY_DN4170_c0_g1~~TRINITY_DN4170_c0_g1_i1.p1  ORF type:complete len:250 (+),score=50.91 TRINITY_DN4170_c0_g1_i1:128-877(+)
MDTFPILLFIGLTVAQFVLSYLFKNIHSSPQQVAFEILAGGCCTWLAIVGTHAWLFDEPLADINYGFSPSAHHIAEIMFGYQLYDLLVCLWVAELRTAPMIIHHALTATLAYISLQSPFAHSYVIFFFGVSEVSNIFLTLIDLLKMFPRFAFAPLEMISQAGFILSYFVFRIGFWSVISVKFWIGSFGLLESGKAHSKAVVWTVLLSNIVLTVLQFYWATFILAAIRDQLFPAKTQQKETQQNGKAKTK